ncbi:MAG: imidazole glycerol phosphate synthase subunit HisH [Candidatus Omnitrophica bacterium]|nr:imidazole glycerol phosphate synthase subunit HisH [Candidatus Omnitrophota bacterium]
MTIAIIDYGMGNIHSVQKALQLSGGQAVVTNNPGKIKSADKIVLPGVGAFSDALLELEKQGLVSALKEAIKEGKPFLGICLGMQLLFKSSEEAKGSFGLDVLKGKVDRFKSKPGLKVPHMGWNQLKIKKRDCPLLKNIEDNAFVYFCHSYYPKNQDKEATAAATDYGIEFSSILWQDNLYGVQFHPEKSQLLGLSMLKNFVELC